MTYVELAIKISEDTVAEIKENIMFAESIPRDIRWDITSAIVTAAPLGRGHCKDCKYFEYDSVAEVDGIPLIVAHEICKRWGDGCKTRENGYCFLFEPQESGEKHENRE